MTEKLAEHFNNIYTNGGGFYGVLEEMNKALEDKPYYDFLGEWWESDQNMTNKFKAQFFTPIDVCRLMEELTVSDLDESPRVMYDCCCGSGRFGLVHHDLRPQDLFFFNDLDDYAVKMTLLNMVCHGMRGVVAHMNTLTEEVVQCWQVTPYPCGLLGYIVPYGTDIGGALSMLPRGKTIEAPTINTMNSDKQENVNVQEHPKTGGLDDWL